MKTTKLSEPLIVPYGVVTVKVGKKGTRRYLQGQRVPAGSEVVEVFPENLVDDLGLKREAPKSETKKETKES